MQVCEEGAFEVLAVQVDFVLAGDLLWLGVLFVRCVYPYSAIADALALAVGDASVSKDVNVGPLTLSEITAPDCARRKTHSGKQNEFSRSRSAINFGQEDSESIAIHLKVASRCAHRCW